MAFSKPVFGLGKALFGGAGLLIGGAAVAGLMLLKCRDPTPYGGTGRRWIIEAEPTAFGEEHELERTNEILSGESQTSRGVVRVVNPLLERRQAEVLTVQSNSSAYDSHGNTEARAEHQHHQTDENDQEGGQHEESGGQEAGGSNGGGTGGDAGGQGSDNDEEDNSSDDSSDSSSDSSISELVESSGDEEDSTSYDTSDSTCQPSFSEHGESSSDFSSDSTLQLKISEDEIRIGLFNSNSINNKQFRISKFKDKFKLEVLTLTETRVTLENGDQRLGEISAGLKVFHQPRGNEEGKSKKHTGGGVATLPSEEFLGQRVQFEDTSLKSFEYVAVDLKHKKWDRPIRTVTVYRPPGGNDEDMCKFLEEFQELLNKFSDNDSILITGDFNIRVNDKNNKHAKWFKKLLRDNGFRQHVREPTHNRGNTLDLVITRNVNINNLHVKKPKEKPKIVIDKKTKEEKEINITISDHYLVTFSAGPLKRKCTESPGTPSKKFKDSQK